MSESDRRIPPSGASQDSHPSAAPPPPNASGGTDFSGHKFRYPNPPETGNPDPVTLREQWRFAIRQYSKWYSHAWGTAILAGASFFALGWILKGSNPLPSLQGDQPKPPDQSPSPEKD